MIGLIAILIGFLGGVIGHAWRPGEAHQRLVAFFVPLTICALVLHLPFLMDALRTGLLSLTPQQWQEWGVMQFFCMTAAFLVTGAGWLLAALIQEVFNEKSSP